MSSTDSIPSGAVVTSERNTTPTTENDATIADNKQFAGHSLQTGAPLGDRDVWKGGHDGRKVNTAKGVTRSAAAKLGEALSENPRSSLQRLEADSSNGTPVVYNDHIRLPGYGIVDVNMTVENGDFDLSATLNLYKYAVRKSDLAEAFVDDKLAEGRPSITFKSSGKIQHDGSIEGFAARFDIAKIPAISNDKISFDKYDRETIGDANKPDATPEEFRGALEILNDIREGGEQLIPLILGQLVDNISPAKVRVKGIGYAAIFKALIGDGRFEVDALHLFSGDTHNNKKDIDVKATVKGEVLNWGSNFKIDGASIGTVQKDLRVSFPGEGKGRDMKITSKGNELPSDTIQEMVFAAMFSIMNLLDA